MCDDCRYPGELAQQEPDDEHAAVVSDAEWAEWDRRHLAEVHGGGACDCELPF